jgi:hypothetical protein
MLRPALVCLAVVAGGAVTASCGMVEGDPNRFESLARNVANISLDGESPASAPEAAATPGMRPAILKAEPGDLRVEVLETHEFWDARDGGLRGLVGEAGARAAEVAAPVVAEAVVQQASGQATKAAPMRPAILRAPVEARTTIQLGAYSTPEAARAAWADVSGGAARNALKSLSPVFETVQVNGRPFTRLRVAAPAAAAVAICRAAEVSDPWCARRV